MRDEQFAARVGQAVSPVNGFFSNLPVSFAGHFVSEIFASARMLTHGGSVSV
jgi:hypothetical protein